MIIGQELDLIPCPRTIELGDYDWFDLEHQETRVGKARCRIEGDRLTIFSIHVYPEHARKGFGRTVIEYFKTEYGELIADRVRPTACEFWLKVGFRQEGDEREGRYVWRRC